MKEIERIIAKGHFSRDFLQPETLCDFPVDGRRKRLWLVGLDLLSELDSVCRRHNLRYFLFFGSLLGVIRHHGFIPWDDDIDIAMPREDYERLKDYVGEFQEPYFLQTPQTDEGYYFTFNKLRNSHTSFVSEVFRYEPFNQGICIDLFPLDNYTAEGLEEKFEQVKTLAVDLSTYMRMRHPDLDEAGRRRLATYSGRPPMETWQRILQICQADNDKACPLMGWMSGNVYGAHRQSFPREVLQETVDTDFYGLQVPIPKNYDAVLRTLYGDYMSFPPVTARGTWHSGVIVDTDTPYIYYIKKI